MQFDEVFEHTGHFGPYQLVLYILLGIVGIPNGYQNLATTFIGGKQDHWCRIPELLNLTHNQQRVVGIPLIRESDGNIRYDQCYMFNLNYSSYTYDELVNWNRTARGIDDKNTPKLQCSSWVWDQSQYRSTVLSEWNLVCDRAPLVPLLSTIYIFGMFVGGVSSGALSDRFGRKKVFLIGLFLETVFALIGAFATSYAFFAVKRFLVSVTAAAAFTTTFVLIMESIGPKARVYCGVFYQAFFSLGFALLPLMAYFIRDFRKLQIAMAIPPIILQVYWFIIPESPRWLVSKGRHEEAIKILQTVAKINKKTLPEKLTFSTEENEAEDFKDVAMKEFHTMKSTEKMVPDTKEVKGSVLDLFRTPRIRCRTFNIWFNWFVNSMVYYGLSLNTGNLSGDIYVNTTLSAIVEFPALLIAAIALDKINRRWPLGLTMITGGAACLACIPLLYRKKDLGAVLNTISMIGKLMLSASFAIIYVFSAELYPTCIRNVGVGSASTAARISGMASPFIGRLNEFWPPIPSIIFGSFSLAAGFLAFLLPETKDKVLPETLEEGERFGLDDDTDEPYATITKGEVNQGFKDDIGLRPLSVGDDKPKMVTQL